MDEDGDYDKTLSSTSNYSRSGWCDFCESFFRFRDRHIRSKKHQTNRPREAFQKLDELISVCGTLDDFIHRTLVDTKKRKRDDEGEEGEAGVAVTPVADHGPRSKRTKTLSVCFEDEVHRSSDDGVPVKRGKTISMCFDEDKLPSSDYYVCPKVVEVDSSVVMDDTIVMDESVVVEPSERSIAMEDMIR